MEDWRQRTQLLLGDEKMERLRQAHVLVVGLGGVGAYDDCGCRYGATNEFEPSASGFAFYAGDE